MAKKISDPSWKKKILMLSLGACNDHIAEARSAKKAQISVEDRGVMVVR